MVEIYICDDECYWGEILGEKISNILSATDIKCNITFESNLDDLKTLIDDKKPDILYLDIMINNENSAKWAKEVLNGKNIQTIFMTAFPTEAHLISEVEHIYYLIKSKLTDKSLENSLKKALTNISQNEILVRSGNENLVINTQDIYFAESRNNNVILHTESYGNVSIYKTLKEFKQTLPPCFLHCHKSYSINMNKIASFHPYEFVLSSGDKITVPVKRYKHIVSAYKEYLNLK